MTATLHRAPTSNFGATSLNGAINDSVDTITLNSTSGLQSPGYLVIDRQDNNGNNTPDAREVVSYTGISGSDVTGVTRAADNSTARSHSDGALVEPVLTVGMWNDLGDLVAASLSTVDGSLNPISTATITTLNVTTLNLTAEPAGVVGQFYWSRSGSLATVLAATTTDTHFPLVRATKNLTINGAYASLLSAPSTAAFQADINYKSTPTADATSIFTNPITVDVGEYDTTTAATAPSLSLTSLASGTLLQLEVDKPGDAGGLGISLQVTSR